MVSTLFNPTWREHEKDLNNPNSEIAIQAGEQFDKERDKELEVSKRARDWEKGRKQEWADAKPKHSQEVRDKEDFAANQLKKLKNGGTYMRNLEPMPGFLLVRRKKLDNISESGIIIPDAAGGGLPNTGVVVRTGANRVHESGVVEECYVKEGDEILYKWGAGLELNLKEGQVVLMGFSDVLGKFNK